MRLRKVLELMPRMSAAPFAPSIFDVQPTNADPSGPVAIVGGSPYHAVASPGTGFTRTESLNFSKLVNERTYTSPLLPLAYSLGSEKRLVRATYHRAVAMEIVDGEMEVLVAGAWRAASPGTHLYPIHAAAATNLPPGRFLLNASQGKLRLEWQPSVKMHGGAVVREATVR